MPINAPFRVPNAQQPRTVNIGPGDTPSILLYGPPVSIEETEELPTSTTENEVPVEFVELRINVPNAIPAFHPVNNDLLDRPFLNVDRVFTTWRQVAEIFGITVDDARGRWPTFEAMKVAVRRKLETAEKKNERLGAVAAKMRDERAGEPSDKADKRRAAVAAANRQRRAGEPPDKADERRAAVAAANRQRRANETPEERERRLGAGREQRRSRVADTNADLVQGRPVTSEQVDGAFEHSSAASVYALYDMAGRTMYPDDADGVLERLRDEEVTPGDKLRILGNFCDDMDPSKPTYACGACGIREFLPRVPYAKCRLDALDVLRLTDSQKAKYLEIDAEFRPVVSCYAWTREAGDGPAEVIYYHLHQELVDEPDGNHDCPTTLLCSECHRAANPPKGGREPSAPEYSIAAGVDFGVASRILHFLNLTLAEQIILAPERLYIFVIKLASPSASRQDAKKRGHAVAFPHDGPAKAAKAIETLDDLIQEINGLSTYLRVAFVGPNGRYETVRTGLPRIVSVSPYRLIEALRALQALNPYYRNLDLGFDLNDPEERKKVEAKIEQACKDAESEVMEKADFVEDETAIAVEREAMADVADVRQAEPGEELPLEPIMVRNRAYGAGPDAALRVIEAMEKELKPKEPMPENSEGGANAVDLGADSDYDSDLDPDYQPSEADSDLLSDSDDDTYGSEFSWSHSGPSDGSDSDGERSTTDGEPSTASEKGSASGDWADDGSGYGSDGSMASGMNKALLF